MPIMLMQVDCLFLFKIPVFLNTIHNTPSVFLSIFSTRIGLPCPVFCILYHLERFSLDVNGICTFWFYCTYMPGYVDALQSPSSILMWEESWQYWNKVRHRKKWWSWFDVEYFLYFFFWKVQQHPLTCRWFCYLSHDVGRKRATTTSETTSKR